MNCRARTGIVVAVGLLIVVQYWMLADLSEWLVVDSYAAEHFPKEHPVWAVPVALMWGADRFGGRYLFTLVLIFGGWHFVRRVAKAAN